MYERLLNLKLQLSAHMTEIDCALQVPEIRCIIFHCRAKLSLLQATRFSVLVCLSAACERCSVFCRVNGMH